MASWWREFCDWFWQKEVWLPPGFTWEKLKHPNTPYYPEFYDVLTYPFLFAFILIFLRYFVFDPIIFNPVGRMLGCKDIKPHRPANIPILEDIYVKFRKKAPRDVILQVSETVSLTERQVERWLRQRAASDRVTELFKFRDAAFQWLYYVCYCAFGLYVLYDKPWLWDIKHCWYGFPTQPLTNDLWWYYIIPLSFYWAMTFTFLWSHRRKDSLQMFIHHILTIFLIVFSWAVNLIRGGSLVLIVHECADIPLLMAKMCEYTGHADMMDPFFVIFILLWVATRIGLFPFWILRSTMFEAHVILNMWYPIYYIFNGMLLLLLIIHFIWTYFIIKILVHKLMHNEISDVLSSDEASEKENIDKKD